MNHQIDGIDTENGKVYTSEVVGDSWMEIKRAIARAKQHHRVTGLRVRCEGLGLDATLEHVGAGKWVWKSNL